MGERGRSRKRCDGAGGRGRMGWERKGEGVDGGLEDR